MPRKTQMQELPTFTKWLPFEDSPSKSKPVPAHRSVHGKAPGAPELSPEDKVEAAQEMAVPASKVTRRGCLPAYHICGGRTTMAATAPDLAKDEGSGHRHSKSAGRRCLPAFHTCGRREVAAVAPDLRGERSGCCFAQGGCLPKFQNCGRRRRVAAADVPSNGEGLVADAVDSPEKGVSEGDGSRSAQRKGCLPTFHNCAGRKRVAGVSDVHKEEGVVVDDVVVLQEKGDVSKSGQRRGCLPAFHVCAGRKRVAGVSDEHEEEADVVVLQEKGVSEGDGSKSAQRKGCLPAFHNCAGRKGATDLHKEEAVVAGTIPEKPVVAGGIPDFCKEEEVAAASIPDLTGEHSKSARKGCCWPKFHMCGGRQVAAGSIPDSCKARPVAAGGIPDICKEKLVAAGGIPDLCKEKVSAAAGVPDLTGEHSSKSARRSCCWPKFNMCLGRRVAPGSPSLREEEGVAAGSIPEKPVAADVPDLSKKAMAADSIPDLHKEEGLVAGVQELGKEEEDGVSDLGQEVEGGCCGWFRCGRKGGKETSCGGRSSRSEQGCWTFQSCGSWCFPTLHICGGRKKIAVRVPDLRDEEGLVAGGVSARHEEVLAPADVADWHDEVVATGHSESTLQCCCRGGCLSPFRICRRRKTVAEGEEEGGRRRSKPKRKGFLRRRGRRQREGKDRKREREKF